MKKLSVGVIGCGGIAQMMHLPFLEERPDLFEIAALADPSRAVLDAVGDRYRVGRRFESFQPLLEEPLDAVLVLASGSHVASTVAAVRAGKHVLVEKPLGIGVREAESVAEVARGAKTTLMVGYHKRYDPAYRAARDLVRKMKDLRYVDVTVLHPDDGMYRTHHAVLPLREKKPYVEAAEMRSLAEEVVSGPDAAAFASILGADAPVARKVALSLGFGSVIHDVNLVRGILGDPRRVISSHVWREGWAQTSVSEMDAGVRATFTWVNLPELKHYEETVRFVGPDQRVTLVFPSPYLKHHPTRLLVERMDGPSLVVEDHTPSHEEAFRAELHAFRQCVLEGQRPETDIDDALGDARWLEAMAKNSSL